MSWHNKWSWIKHRKAAQDSKKAQIYAKHAKIIQLEAWKWDDLDLNPSLANAVSNAKSAWVPKDVIEKAIMKWAWKSTWEKLEEIFYEWYGPAGVALYIKCITSNTNRSAANVRSILTKYGWNMGQAGSVSWQFSPKWVIYISWKIEKVKEKWKNIENILPLWDDFEDFLLEADIEDYELSEEWARIISSRENLSNVTKFFEINWYKIENSEIEYIPENIVSLTDENQAKLDRIIEKLEDDEDVDSVSHNAE